MRPHPFRDFMGELAVIIPPFTFAGALRRGPAALAINIAVAVVVGVIAWQIALATGAWPQWIAVGTGFYAVFSWASALRFRDPPTFRLIWGTPAFLQVTVGYGLIAFMAYGISFWGAPYAERVLGLGKAELGLILGGGSAVGGFLGVVLGGRIADALRRRYAWGRIPVILFGMVFAILPLIVAFNTTNVPLFYFLSFVLQVIMSSALGAAAATTQDLVLPRMRGTATATFFIGTTLIGLSLGPYLAGQVSAMTGSLRIGILSLLSAAPISIVLLMLAWRGVPYAEASVVERARAAGEPI